MLEDVETALLEGSTILRDVDAGAPDSDRMHELLQRIKLSDQGLRHLQGRLQLIKEKLHSQGHLQKVEEAADKSSKMTASLKVIHISLCTKKMHIKAPKLK